MPFLIPFLLKETDKVAPLPSRLAIATERHQRYDTDIASGEEGCWRKYTHDEIIGSDKTSLDIFWLKDKSLTDLDNLPDPDILAREIIENIEAGLNSFREIMETINGETE